jgi:hypothetical protein
MTRTPLTKELGTAPAKENPRLPTVGAVVTKLSTAYLHVAEPVKELCWKAAIV